MMRCVSRSSLQPGFFPIIDLPHEEFWLPSGNEETGQWLQCYYLLTQSEGVAKMRNAHTRSVVGFLLITFLLSLSPALGQQQPTPKQQVLWVVVYDGDLAALLASLARTYDVTIGFETVSKEPRPRVSFQIQDATRNQVFDAIVQADPQFQWRERDGVIEFFPVTGASFLDTAIGSLKLSNANWMQATDSLLNLTEARDGMRTFGLSQRPVKQDAPQSKPITLDLTNVTVRDALNKFAAQTETHFWVSRQFGGVLSI